MTTTGRKHANTTGSWRRQPLGEHDHSIQRTHASSKIPIASDPLLRAKETGNPVRCAVVQTSPIKRQASDDAPPGHKQEVIPLYMELMVHDCNDPKCSKLRGAITNAEIQSAEPTTRFSPQTRGNDFNEFYQQLKRVQTTPRRKSMLDYRKPHTNENNVKLDKDDEVNAPDRQCRGESAILHDPAVVRIGVREDSSKPTPRLNERFEELLRKLRISAKAEQKHEAKKLREGGPQDHVPPIPKPVAPDSFKQMNYEAYIEHRKATEPGYALKCKERQAKRALRNNAIKL
ncbi:hypothetical protein CTRI78_v003069 [Colletotrichum trifolii]|uniref:Uncharacterized protein n=1 Tax=Colletotrichum trifolii TaxID=5466 RepID=A0A4R8RWA8_COLTR|nr:hypothetical protein CTRI78_v003069 [Colletotrichum trifolii]